MLNHTLSRKACIAVAAMVDLELHADNGPVSLAPLSERLQVSLSYLEQIFALLRRPGLLQSSRGRGGGYLLGRAACDISVADIIGALDTSANLSDGQAGSHESWPFLNRRLAACLSSVSVQELADELPRHVVHELESDAEPALRRGISTRPVLEPIALPAHVNSVFFLADALK